MMLFVFHIALVLLERYEYYYFPPAISKIVGQTKLSNLDEAVGLG